MRGRCRRPRRRQPTPPDTGARVSGLSAVRALAQADVTDIADSFSNAGWSVQIPARGILLLTSPTQLPHRPRLLLSVGIHGDETAPIELLGLLLHELAQTPRALALDLMIVVGNPAAIAQEKRFVDVDLNRLFSDHRDAMQTSVESVRADEIMRATASFFAEGVTEKWHFDLHTAIRPSLYPAFAVLPGVLDETRKHVLLGWLGSAGIGAAILNRNPAGTYSAYTADACGAASATIELGQVATLGCNDLSRFDAARAALDAFLRGGVPPVSVATPHVFKVAQELVKRSESFRLAFSRDTPNFAAFQPGMVIAQDGTAVYRVGAETEYVVFPNPDVRIGLRAGLMVVRVA